MRRRSASLTALQTARLLAALGHDLRRRSILPRGAAEATERLLMGSGLARPWMARLWESPLYRRFLRFIEKHTMPGHLTSFAAKKRFIDLEVRAGAEEGAEQVLVVGAGFDTLCWRLASELPEVRFVETDHPATSAKKREALREMGAWPDNLELLPVDLTRGVSEALAAAKCWRRGARSVVVAEGVLMYLDEEEVERFLDQLASEVGEGSRLLFTWLPRNRHGILQLGRAPWLLRGSLAAVGERLKWGARPGQLAHFLAGHGFTLDESEERADLRKRVLAPLALDEEQLGQHERCAVAEKLGPVPQRA